MSRGASFVLRPFGGTTLYRINGRSVIFIPAMALGAHPTLLTTGAPFLLAIGRTAFPPGSLFRNLIVTTLSLADMALLRMVNAARNGFL